MRTGNSKFANFILELSQVILVFLGVFSALMCSAAKLELSYDRRLFALIMLLSAILFYFLFTVLETFRNGKLYGILGITLFSGVVVLRFLPAVKKGSIAIINNFLKGLMAYTDTKFPLLSYSAQYSTSVRFCTTLVLSILGVYITAIVSAFFYRRRRSAVYLVLTIPFVVLPLFVGRIGYFSNMFTYLIVTISIVGTRHFRTDATDRRMRQKLSVILMITGLVAGGASWLLVPPERYDRKSGQITQIKNSMVALMTWEWEDVVSWMKAYLDEDTMDYGKIGKKNEVVYSGKTVLKVSGDINTNHGLYLKGYVGDKYRKNKWSSNRKDEQFQSDLESLERRGISPDNWHIRLRNQLDVGIATGDFLNEQGTLRIRNVGFGYGNYVIPYLPVSSFKHSSDGKATIDTLGIDYTVPYYMVYAYIMRRDIQQQNYSIGNNHFWESTKTERQQMTDFVNKYYLEVPKSLNKVCEEYKTYLNDNGNVYDDYKDGRVNLGKVLTMTRTYITRDTEYSLAPGKTPSGMDTVDYFLNEGKKGYCSYYATTATMLLRSAGIPCRYVEGIYISKEEIDAVKETGKELEVPDRDAHAWVEVYDDKYGFVIFEVTPGVGESDLWQMDPDDYHRNNDNTPSETPSPEEKQDDTQQAQKKPTPTPAVTQTPEESMIFDDIEGNEDPSDEDKANTGNKDSKKAVWMILVDILIGLVLIMAALEVQRRIRRMLFQRGLGSVRISKRIRMAYHRLMPVYIHRKVMFSGQTMAEYTEQLAMAMRMPEAEISVYVELIFHARFGPEDITEEQMDEFRQAYEKIRAKAYADAKIFRKLYYMYIAAL